jgi:hypothetical protein
VKGAISSIIAGVLFVLAAIGLVVIYVNSNKFATNELPVWIETTALINDAWVTDVEIDSFQKESPYDYRVVFSYIITFATEAGAVTFENRYANTGSTTSTTTVPDSAYDIFRPGDMLNITYNPNNPESYHFGTKSEVEASFRSATPLLFVSILGLIGVSLLLFGIRKIQQ